MTKVFAVYDGVLIAEPVVGHSVVLAATRVFQNVSGVEGSHTFTNGYNGDKIHVRETGGRLLVTKWETEDGDDSAVLITGTDGSSVYRYAGRHIGFRELAEIISARPGG